MNNKIDNKNVFQFFRVYILINSKSLQYFKLLFVIWYSFIEDDFFKFGLYFENF